MKLQSQAPPRPMTHDLLSDMLEQLEAQVVRITVTELRENTFYAQITRAAGRTRDRGRLASVRRDRARDPRRGADLRGRPRDRGVGDRVRGRRRRPGSARRGGRRSSGTSSTRSRPRTSPSRTAKTSRSQAEHGDGERDAVEEPVHDHPRDDAARAVAQIGEPDRRTGSGRAAPGRARARGRTRRRRAGSTASAGERAAATGRRRGTSAPRRPARRP